MNGNIIFFFAHWLTLFYVRRRRIRRRRWINRRWWVRPINENRNAQGDYLHLFQELKEDETMFFRYTRMSKETFALLLRLVGPSLTKNNWRAILPEHRLIFTLR